MENSKGKNDKGEEVFVDDAMIDKLLDDQAIGESKREADKQRRMLNTEEYHQLRALAKRDLFFLAYTVLGYRRLSTVLHGDLCTKIHDTQNRRFREWLMPRGHFKSTVITISHAIQIALPYTEEDRQHDLDPIPLEWPYTLGPDGRLLIGHETSEGSARFLFAITSHFLSNPLLMALFPDAIPEKPSQRINKWELELPRSSSARAYPEPTVDTMGVGVKSQGRHYNYIKLDDIFGEKARDSVAESETTKEWFDGIQSFFSSYAKDHLDLIGTRYSLDDIYEHAHDRYGEQLFKYCRRVEEPVRDKHGATIVGTDGKPVKKPIFPEEFTPEVLEIQRKNKRRFSAEYENDPDDGVSGFDNEWKRYFYWTDHNELAIFDGEKGGRINVRDLDICILIDPGHKTGGFAVTGMDYLGRVFVLVALPLDLRPPELTELVFRNVIRWQPRTVAFEADLFADVFQFYWASEMARRGIKFHITPVRTKSRTKDERILGLTHYLTSEKFFVNDTQDELLAEWKKVGRTRNVHIFDAIAYGPEVWRPGYAPGQRDILEIDVGEQDMSGRDAETGYSKIEYDTEAMAR